MKSQEEKRLDALIRGRDYCNTHAVALNAIDVYGQVRAKFDASIAKVIAARKINMSDISNFAVTKAQAQSTMVEEVYKFMMRGAIKASEIGDSSLEYLLEHPITYFHINDAATIGVRCTEIKNILKNNMATLTNIKLADVTTMEEAISAFDLSIDSPKEAIDNRKANGTGPMTETLNDSNIPKNNMGKIFYSYLPALSDGWDQAIKVGRASSVRHISVVIKFTDELTGVVLKNVKCTFNNEITTVVKTSTKRGYVRVFSLLTGTWSAKCEHKIYTTHLIENIGVEDKRIARYEVVMKKKMS